MFRIFITSALFWAALFFLTFSTGPTSVQASSERPVPVRKLKDVFSHPAHLKAFRELKIQCTDCHTFSIQPTEVGPLAPLVPRGLLASPRQVCHQCHLEKIKLPRPNQCSLCHQNPELLAPKSHSLNWLKRHGPLAQFNLESCKDCHGQNSCTQCHEQKIPLQANAHPANFKFFHSVSARSNPQSCTVCHQSQKFCLDCHQGSRK